MMSWMRIVKFIKLVSDDDEISDDDQSTSSYGSTCSFTCILPSFTYLVHLITLLIPHSLSTFFIRTVDQIHYTTYLAPHHQTAPHHQ